MSHTVSKIGVSPFFDASLELANQIIIPDTLKLLKSRGFGVLGLWHFLGSTPL